MNRFIAQRSALFVVVTVVFVAALFADGANLDDLCPGAIILHDDDEVAVPANFGLDAQPGPGAAHRHSAFPSPHSRHGDSKSSPAAPVRVVVDQDSPSLQAEWRLGMTSEPGDAAGCVPAAYHAPPAPGALHLRFCTLLI